MNHELDTSLLISLLILVAVIVFVVWWYGVRKEKTPNTVAFESPGYRDKLTLIDGIGATLEGKLNSLGITTFKQIAEFDQRDIERVNEQLAFKGRIEREGWVAQASKLLEAGSRTGKANRSNPGEPPARPARVPAGNAARKTAGKTTGKKNAAKTSKKKAGSKKTTKKTAKKTGNKTSKKAGKKTKKKARSTKR